jgi:peptidoglycan/xylan/chitin deacetylase (PgdA/CDA1 family)
MRVALTIDTEHPDRPCSGRALDGTLAALDGIPATFFIEGRWARANPEDAVKIAAAGHVLGNHSQHHAPFDFLTDGGIAKDLAEAEETIQGVMGRSPRPWFRCPFGAGMHDARVLAAISAEGYTHVAWDVDPRDWHEDNDAAEVERAVLTGVRERDDSIVLLHSWPDVTAAALPGILDGLAAAGAELVDVGALTDVSASRP